jgi:leader peptidase (prepilin peptidase)/N-methyltransferase
MNDIIILLEQTSSYLYGVVTILGLLIGSFL